MSALDYHGPADWEDSTYGESSWDAADWRRRWPSHCRACRGWGGSSHEESHGFRGGGTETIFEVCDALPEDTCHRCGHSGPGDEGQPALGSETNPPCPACGWDYDDGEPIDWGGSMVRYGDYEVVSDQAKTKGLEHA